MTQTLTTSSADQVGEALYQEELVQRLDKLVRLCAEIIHNTNRSYCQSLGDNSQLPWSMPPDWQKDSIINGVLFHLDNQDASPADSHKNWLAQKAGEGWSYGKVKDVAKKQHPCFLPYDDLPEEQKVKDLFTKHIIAGFFTAYED